MTIRLTQIEDQLAESPFDTATVRLTQLECARRALEDVFQSPLPLASYRQARVQADALDAAIEILRRLAQRFGASYGCAGKRQP
ncbi:EscE/YscE/SsaE family type III secretion system needle protein co-chaperone [Pandoraea pneumonica]|uniref:EscE/YscE/SsaE family type III secretion system needle protein co-chaperone n=1 Tax=Pandoraea pneumonica TaxID=2508299 RepID=UPI003CE864C8